MKKLLLFSVASVYSMLSIQAQTIPSDKERNNSDRQVQEIIIRKKGDKDASMKIEFNGDKVIINGKPLIEFKEDGVTINNRKIVINGKVINEKANEFLEDFEMNFGRGNVNFEKRPFLGIVSEKADDGARIISVSKESAAEKAGLQKDDILVKIEDIAVSDGATLYNAIGKFKIGETVKVKYKRNGKMQDAKVTLGETRPNEKVVQGFSMTTPRGSMKSFSIPNQEEMERRLEIMGSPRTQRLGLRIEDTQEGNGVKILELTENAPAATAGLKVGDILTELNGKKITDTETARNAMQENIATSTYPVKVLRNGNVVNLTVIIPKKLKTANL